jgi:hypothetical protein
MDTTSEQLEIDLGDDVVTIKSAEFQWTGAGGSSGIMAQEIGSVDWNNMATSITIPSTYTVGATGSLNWSQDYSINGTSVYGNASVILNEKGMEIKEGGDIKIGGKSLSEAIDKIEERLGILHPNPELEDRWEELKNLRKQYQELEKDLLQKEKMWTILKKA